MASDNDTGPSKRITQGGKRGSLPSLPPASERNLSRVGEGGGGERPLRAQLVIGGVIALILLAVPLYLLRRPAPVTPAAVDAAAVSAPGFGGVVHTEPADAGATRSDIELGPVQRVRCGSSPRTLTEEGSACDALPPLEKALRRAIERHRECAPRAGRGGSINYVLELDFDRRHLGMFAGKSGSWKGPQARTAAQCILRSLGPVQWEGVKHRYRYYAIALLATYEAPDPLEELPVFD
jgi:hypothetical protein